jgi:hypothetical protein
MLGEGLVLEPIIINSSALENCSSAFESSFIETEQPLEKKRVQN